MNCRTIQEQLMRAADREMVAPQPSVIDAHLRTCEHCRQFAASLETVSAVIAADATAVTVPSEDTMWASVQSRLNESGKPAKKSRKLAPIIWIAAPLAAAAAWVFAILPSKPSATHQVATVSHQSSQADYVETPDPDATTMVYVDKESGWLVVWTDDPTANRG